MQLRVKPGTMFFYRCKLSLILHAFLRIQLQNGTLYPMPPPPCANRHSRAKSSENIDISVTTEFTITYLRIKNIDFYRKIYAQSWKKHRENAIFRGPKMQTTAEWNHFIQCPPPVRKIHDFVIFVVIYAVTAHPARICRYLLDYSPVHRFYIVKRLTTAALAILSSIKHFWFWHSFLSYARFGRFSWYLQCLRDQKTHRFYV